MLLVELLTLKNMVTGMAVQVQKTSDMSFKFYQGFTP